MRLGHIPPGDATRMAYVADIGHRLVRAEEELRNWKQALEKLDDMKAQQSIAPYNEYLSPAAKDPLP